MARLSLVVPGLLGPWPGELLNSAELPSTPALNKLLNRGQTHASANEGFEAALCAYFQLTDSDLPIAALCYPVDSGQEPQDICLRADPVHIRAEMYQLILRDVVQIERTEAETLRDAFNETFHSAGIRLETPVPKRWYLRSPQAPKLSTVPLSQALSQDITPLLPGGPDAKHWHALLTECQMLFHDHPVNQTREAQGLPTINSVWLWGGGVLPAAKKPDFAEVFGNDVLIRGLARWAGLAINPLPDSAEDWLEIAADDGLLIVSELQTLVQEQDFSAWSEALQVLERNWFAPLLSALSRSRIKRLGIDACDGRRFIVSGRDLRRFWRRIRPLEHWLSA